MSDIIKFPTITKVIFAAITLVVFLIVIFLQPFIKTSSASLNISNQLVSYDYTNTQNGNYYSMTSPYITDNGQKVAFSSSSSDHIASDANAHNSDMYMRNIGASTTELINKTYQGVQTSNSVTPGPVSENGRFALFSTSETGIVDAATQYNEIYIRDTSDGTTKLVTSTSSSQPANNTSSDMYGVSNDGRFVLFKSTATNLISGASYPVPQGQIFLKDMSNDQVTLISKSEGGTNGNSNSNSGASMSCDGAFITFGSSSTNLVSNDTNGKKDIFLVDLRNGFRIKNITRDFNNNSDTTSISCNGNYVTFMSNANNIISGVSGSHMYAYERLTGNFSLVDQSSEGNVSNGDTNSLTYRTVSNDGKVVFASRGTNLVSTPTIPINSIYVYIHDINDGTTEIISINSNGQLSDTGFNTSPTISVDGKKVAYISNATNLAPGKTDTRTGVILATIE